MVSDICFSNRAHLWCFLGMRSEPIFIDTELRINTEMIHSLYTVRMEQAPMAHKLSS
jgi:hypothetical protein